MAAGFYTFVSGKHGQEGWRCPILTDRDLDLIVQTLGKIGNEQADRDLDGKHFSTFY